MTSSDVHELTMSSSQSTPQIMSPADRLSSRLAINPFVRSQTPQTPGIVAMSTKKLARARVYHGRSVSDPLMNQIKQRNSVSRKFLAAEGPACTWQPSYNMRRCPCSKRIRLTHVLSLTLSAACLPLLFLPHQRQRPCIPSFPWNRQKPRLGKRFVSDVRYLRASSTQQHIGSPLSKHMHRQAKPSYRRYKSSLTDDAEGMSSCIIAAGGTRVVAAMGSPDVSTLILVRHGESEWNRAADERFTGWFDVPLSELGMREASEAGKLLHQRGILDSVEVAFTSKLKRSYGTLELILKDTERCFPVVRSWRLNERHYGALQGYNKDAVIGTLYDKEDVRKWRRAWDAPPPPMADTHPHYEIIKSQYTEEELAEMGGDIPRGESLEQTAQRLMPFWEKKIFPYVLLFKTQ